ncbi:hypothetical protein NA57DRAFT_77863 [Rhizodiscina lignyota]|uniref:Homeobox domain-containing protein n=1 Tax=Rhizodiscina lignyota TaxID=1504668 RepID=A0A9P4I9S0_9PEZI|nr:hypothetical protein NA57DRAFT_77863 [Rhizodiscina lignyota]
MAESCTGQIEDYNWILEDSIDDSATALDFAFESSINYSLEKYESFPPIDNSSEIGVGVDILHHSAPAMALKPDDVLTDDFQHYMDALILPSLDLQPFGAVYGTNPAATENSGEQETAPVHGDTGDDRDLGPSHPILPKAIHPQSTIKRPRLEKGAKTVLVDWFNAHDKYPYPSTADLHALSSKTGLSLKQLRTWFTNRRARIEMQAEHPDAQHYASIAVASKSLSNGIEGSNRNQDRAS